VFPVLLDRLKSILCDTDTTSYGYKDHFDENIGNILIHKM